MGQRERGFEYKTTKLYASDQLPNLDEFDFLVIMGGPMAVYDEQSHPWLIEEKQLIQKAIKAGKLVLGICLGAQLIAEALGAKVKKLDYEEIGWYPIKWLDSDEHMNVFHLHSDGFEIPKGAQLLASSEAHKNQAFSFDKNIIALQFHVELIRQGFDDIVENCSLDKNRVLIDTTSLERCKNFLFQLLENFTA